MKKILSLIFLVIFSATFAYAEDVTLEELKSQITDLQGEVLKMSRRVDKNEVHRILDKVDIGVELRSRVESLSYKDTRALPMYANDMLGLWMRGYMTTFDSGSAIDTATDGMGLTDGFNDSYMITNGATHGSQFQALMNNLNAQVSPSTEAQEFQMNYAKLVGFSAIQPMMTADEIAAAQRYFDDVLQANASFYNAQGDGAPGGAMGDDLAGMLVAGTSPDALVGNLTAAFQGMGIDATTAQMQAMQFVQFAVLRYMFDDTTLTHQEVNTFKSMFKGIEPRKYEHNNSSLFTNKLRIRLNSKVNSNLSFAGRLAMYKVWGDATDVQWMDGTYKSMYLDGNAGAVPTDDKIHVERAYFVYNNAMGPIDWHFSFGRRPSVNGPGAENKEYASLGGSPVSHIIQWQFDGASLQFNFENLIEWLPGSFVKFCYGKGYESGWGSSNATAANNGLIATPEVDDVEFLGVIVRFYDDEQYKLWYNYAKGVGVTDGFTGSVVMPFSVTGQDYDLDGEYDEYMLDPNYTAGSSRTEATAEVGDMEWHALLAQGETFGFSWFASAAMSKSHPDGRSKAAMYQFMDQDRMLGSTDSKTGTSYWFGIATPDLPFTGGKFGFEYNQGSKYWVSMTACEDDTVGSKLAVRGKVYEMYYHQPIVGQRLFATIGYQKFDYDYTGSGSYLGAPVKIEDANAINTMMAVADKVEKIYASFTYRY
ncbi:MAG: DUF3373 domain-containing protein [Denitrovibrio sp.]|nr:MAG: DUF3373 domain-containing protein [Denitrovibrio sp.]